MPVRLTQLNAQRVAAGKSISQLARDAVVSDRLIQRLEAPHPVIDGTTSGTCNGVEAQRIADALGVSLATLGVINL
jgi:hypothetical protein